MAKNREKLAQLLGAKILGEVPDVGGGAFGMARLAHLLHQRLTPSQGERPGRPTDSSWVLRPKVPMSEETANKLAEIADALSTSERRVSPIRAHSIPACASYFDIAHSIWPLQTMLSGRLLPTQEKLSATFVKNPTPTIPFRAGGDTARPGNDPPHVLSSL